MAVIRAGFVAFALCFAGASAYADENRTTIETQDGRNLVFNDGGVDGGRAIVVHDAQGRVVRELALGEFLPAAYVKALPRGEHGLQWRRESKLVGESVEFTVPTPGSAAGANGPALRFSIDLRDGSVRTAQIREYLQAADEAKAIEAAMARRGDASVTALAGGGSPRPTPAIAQ